MLTIHRIKRRCHGCLICRGCINNLYNTRLTKSDVITTPDVDICINCRDKKRLVRFLTPVGYAKTIGR